jgi:hypothetical protein
VFKTSTPPITQGQLAAVVTFIVGQAVAWGVLDTTDSQLAVSVGSTALALVWKAADAYLRGQRARHVAQTQAPPQLPPNH